MEQNDTANTEKKPLSVLERFRQLSRQKEQQPEVVDVKAGGEVGVIYLTSDKTTKGNETESEPVVKEMVFNNRGKGFRGRRGRGGKRNHDQDSKPSPSRIMHQGLLESEIGITEYITPGPGFKGIIKQRFSDFQVNEIDLDGNIVKMTNTDLPVEKDGEVAIEDELSILTQEQWDTLTEMYDTKKEETPVKIDVTHFSKEKRTQIHKAVKKKYGAHIYSNTVDEDGKKFMEIGLSKNKDRRVMWPRNRGEYLHFVVHKENTDTTETIHTLAYQLRTKPNKFYYAGTKDKRAVTSQQMCARRVMAEKLKSLHLRNIYLGNFDYKWKTIRLGDLKGNRFRIALREVDAEDDVIEKAVMSLKENGFLNYFGTQRFGTSVVAPTHMIGKAIMQSDWKQAVELILKPRPNERSYADLATARDTWWETRDAKKALKYLNYKDKTIEGKILQGLDRNGPKAYVNALENLPKNTVSLYAHAYQSFIWNKIISRRFKEFGLVPLAGDLVLDNASVEIVDSELIDNINDESNFESEEKEEDDEGDKDSSDQRKDEPGRRKLNVRVLSEAEAKETIIFDIVYPLPGFDIVYPNNMIAQWYSDMLAEDGLTSETLRQKNRWFSLHGSYRKMVNRPTDVTWKTLRYNNHNMDIIVSDRGRLKGEEGPANIPDGKYKALVVEFNLVPSAYATMALREMLKCETATCHQAALTIKSLTSESVDIREESSCKKMKFEDNQLSCSECNENNCKDSNVNGVHSDDPVTKKQKLEETNSFNENER